MKRNHTYESYAIKSNAKPILQVKNLSIRFPNRYGEIPLVDNISFTVNEGETMGLVGESGCGKSIYSILYHGLVTKNSKITGKCFSPTAVVNNTACSILTI